MPPLRNGLGRRVREAAPCVGRNLRDGRVWDPPLRFKRTALITSTVPLIRHGFAVPPSPKGEGKRLGFQSLPLEGKVPPKGADEVSVF